MQQQLSSYHKFGVYDPLQPDAYAFYLADIHDTCGVIAVDDIYTSQGALVVSRGAPITPAVARHIIQYKLQKPLETSVRLERELHTEQLETDFINLMQQDQILLALHDHDDLTIPLKKYCQSYFQYPLLRQKLTVMAHSLPELYTRSLYCAWLSLLIAKEMRLSEQDIALVFIAALSHDIGMLHVDADILNRKANLTADDWLSIQMHVAIGSQLIQAMPDMPDAVAQALYEHHERCDGTGYPLGKVESELSLSGLIVGLADSIVAIYYHRFKVQGGSWRDVIPIIQMNTQAYFFRNYEILVTILRRSELPLKNVVQGDETPQFIAELEAKNIQLKTWFDIMRECILSIGFRHGDRRLHALQNVMLHVSTSVAGSGIFIGESRLLASDSEPKTAAELHEKIENMHTMQQEISFHLQRLNRMTQLYLDSGECKTNEIKSVLAAGLANTEKFQW